MNGVLGSSKGRVCVSGVTGFVGGHIVRDLLEAGYKVHGAARGIADSARLAHLTNLPDAQRNFRVFDADLTAPGSFDEALQGCDFAIHTASPVTMDSVGDPMRELVDPAVQGTLSFLEGCRKAASVRKIVVTSCAAAIADEGSSGAVLDENVWNESSLSTLPYYYSKTLSEKQVWEWSRQNPHIKVVVLNLAGVLGPSLIPRLGLTPKLIKQIADAQEFPGIMDFSWTFVHVKDVSRAHVAALENDSASGRYICGNTDKPLHMRDVVSVLLDMGYSPKTKNLTSAFVTRAVKLTSHIVPGGPAGHYVRQNLGNPVLYTNEKIKKDLGLCFTDSAQALRETVLDMAKWGHIPAPGVAQPIGR